MEGLSPQDLDLAAQTVVSKNAPAAFVLASLQVAHRLLSIIIFIDDSSGHVPPQKRSFSLSLVLPPPQDKSPPPFSPLLLLCLRLLRPIALPRTPPPPARGPTPALSSLPSRH
ncbi:hypothetical protein NL676_012447 [Syzygium grande]|nr:hypothetical protein NL676_012447 [Syzygium grande]